MIMTSPTPVPLPAAYPTGHAGPPCDLWLDGRRGLRWPEDDGPPTAPSEAYPDASALERDLAARSGVEPERVIVTAGADGALDRACRAFLAPDRRAVLTDPTFAMLPHYVALQGAGRRDVPWPEGPLPVDRLREAAGEATGLVAVVTPSNPTGLVAATDALVDLARTCPRMLLVVDLAYVEFADEDPTAALLAEPNVLVVRTLSKAWGLAGWRIGYALGPESVVAALRAAGGPYPTASAGLALARARLASGDDHLAGRLARTRRERDRLGRLLRSAGLQVPPSQANFVLARGGRAGWLADGLAGLGIAVRDLGAVGTRLSLPAEPDAFGRLWQGCRTALAPEAILLDIDGVVVDVGASYREAIRLTAASFGCEVSAAEIAREKSRPGSNNDWEVTRRLLADRGCSVSLAEVTGRFEGFMDDRQLWRREQLIPARRTLERLAARRSLAAVTGRPRRDARRVLAQLGLDDLVTTTVVLEDAPAKPDPAPVRLALRRLGVRRAWLVGDTPDDMTAARRAGVIPLGVGAPGDAPAATTGRLVSAGAARVLTSLDDLEDLLP
ncbi:aminotransferase class I/II-fold pyridoxal phosphate-dependent enzyme [bacterium]|nr:aminotransferase class I/II-fold pyridoxal phosphate-dependent enzyme [bacterium]